MYHCYIVIDDDGDCFSYTKEKKKNSELEHSGFSTKKTRQGCTSRYTLTPQNKSRVHSIRSRVRWSWCATIIVRINLINEWESAQIKKCNMMVMYNGLMVV